MVRMISEKSYSTFQFVLIEIIKALGDIGDSQAVDPLINILMSRIGQKESRIGN